MDIRYRTFAGLLVLFGSISWLSAQVPPPAKPLPDELRILPTDATFFASFRIKEIWQSELVKPIRDLITKEDPKIIERFASETGVNIADIERISVLMPTLEIMEQPDFLIVVTLTQPIDRAKLLTALEAVPGGRFRMGGEPGAAPRFEKAAPIESPKATKFELKPQPQPPIRVEEKKEIKDCGGVQDDDDAPPPQAKLPLDAAYYHIGKSDGSVLSFINDRTFAVLVHSARDGAGSAALVGMLLRRDPKGELLDAYEKAMGDDHIVVGFRSGTLLNSEFDDPNLLTAPFRSLLSMHSLTVGVKLGETLRLTGEMRFPDATSATKAMRVIDGGRVMLSDMVPAMRKEMLQDPANRPLVKLLDASTKMIDDAEIKVVDQRVRIRAEMNTDVALPVLIMEASRRVGDAAKLTQLANNLKQIGISWHAYHDTMSFFPTDNPDPNKPAVSWRVLILPYIEQENLYRMYKFDEPWDSENNKKLIPLMPKVFEVPGHPAPEKGQTYFQAFAGPGALLEPNPRNPGRFNRMRFTEILDGTSNTIMVAETGVATPWTKPGGLTIDPKQPLPKLGGHFGRKCMLLMCDGAVRTIDLDRTNTDIIRLMILRADGQVIPND